MHSPKAATEDDRIIGARIASIRKAQCLSQKALGEALGVTLQQVQKYEAGKNRIGAGRLFELARFLEVEVAALSPETAAGAPVEPTIDDLRAKYLRARDAYTAAVQREVRAGAQTAF